MMKNISLLILFSVLILSCKKEEKKAGISWFPGTMEEGLKKAKAESKPLFVYWGAKWCPPCNVLRATTFKEDKFIQATNKFISIFLDGDTDQAQEWGEKLSAQGYPTLMILSPQGKEIVRLSSDVLPQELAEAMDSAYDNATPIDQLIEKVLATDSEKVSFKDWKILAQYSWTQARQFKDQINWLDVFTKLEQKIPNQYKKEKDRFFLNALVAQIDVKKKEEVSIKKVEAYRKRFEEFFAEDSSAFEDQYEVFAYGTKDFTNFFYEKKNEERDQFISNYKAAIEKVRKKSQPGENRHIIGFYPLLDFASLDGEALAVIEKDQIKKEMLKAVKNVKSDHHQVFISSRSAYNLNQAGFYEEAKQVLLEDIKKSKTPYYSMASLSSIEKKKGEKAEALKWAEKAYHASKGKATRVQWGSRFIDYMIQLSPENSEKILRELQKFYAVHLKLPDAFMGRNKIRLERLAKSVTKWTGEQKQQESLKVLQKKWLSRCQKKSRIKTDLYKKNCEEYFGKLI